MISVSTNRLTKTFNKGATLAVDAVSLNVNEGELFGLIGPDGAGKTTLFRMLTTLLLPDSGAATVNGYDVVKEYKTIRSQVGYMPGRFSLYQDLTVEENLQFFATLFNTTIRENYALIEDIYILLEPFKDRRAGQLSGGMKQKLALCCALIHKPTILFLDEPTTGVDAVSRKEFWDMLGQLKQQGITILVSTPYMDEATLCDRIGLIQEGRLLSVESPAKIIAAYPVKLYAAKGENMYHLLKDIRTYPEISSCYTFGEYLHLTFKKEGTNNIPALIQYLETKSHKDVQLKEITPTIEDCFIKLLSVP